MAQHIAPWVALVLAAMDKGQSEPMVGGSEQNDGWLAQTLVDLAGELRVLATSVGSLLEFHDEEHEALLLSLVEDVYSQTC